MLLNWKLMKKEEENGKAVDKNKNMKALEKFSFFEEVENLHQSLDSEQHKTNPAIDVIEGAQADLKKQFEKGKRSIKAVDPYFGHTK